MKSLRVVDSATEASQSLRKSEDGELMKIARYILSLSEEEYIKRLDMLEERSIKMLQEDEEEAIGFMPPYMVRAYRERDLKTIEAFKKRRR
jgi:hypothetical protein